MSTAIFKASFSKTPSIFASVVINPNVVAILGCIMPEPFAIPPIVIFLSPYIIATAISFFIISVVIIASLAPIWPCLLRLFTNSSIFSSIKSIFNGFPITPVDATKTSLSLIFNLSLVNLAIL